MRLRDLDYTLPQELIASHPEAKRDGARLLVVHPERLQDAHVYDLDRWLPERALLVANDTRVIPARLLGTKSSGGRVELLLVRREDGAVVGDRGERWRAMGRASRRLRRGAELSLEGAIDALVEAPPDDEGLLTVRLKPHVGSVQAVLERVGRVPLHPYLGRAEEPADRERYQTTFARHSGAVAAPTAGLHFSAELLERLRARGISWTTVSLHVGPGTFLPVSVDDLDDHPMHAEHYEISADAAERIEQARASSTPVIAVGTTVVRALESASDASGRLSVGGGDTRLLIQPGYRFKVVDGLLTNFHLPGSTLLALVYAFAGVDRTRGAYQHAISAGYRFYSYGDAMLITVRAGA